MDNGNFDFQDQDIICTDCAEAFDEKKEKRFFSRIGFGFALFSLVYLGVALIIQLLVYIVYPDFLETTLFANLLSPVSIYLFGLPVLLIVIGGIKAKAPEKKKMKFSAWLMLLIICLGVMYIGAYIGEFVVSNVSGITSYFFESEPTNDLNSLIDVNNLWITAIGVVIVAPVGEELIFRKLLMDRLGRYGAFVSIFLSALLFGLVHGNFYQFFYAFGVGLVFGYVYYATGNILWTIGLHAAVNFFGSIASVWLSMGLQEFVNALSKINSEDVNAILGVLGDYIWVIFAVLVFYSVVLAAIVCAIVLPIALRKKIVLEKGDGQLPKGKGFSTVVGNAGMIVMLAVCGVNFILNLIG